MNETLGGFTSGIAEDAPEGCAGDIHACGSIFMIKPEEIGQTQRFEFIKGEIDDFEIAHGDSGWFKAERVKGLKTWAAAFSGSHNERN